MVESRDADARYFPLLSKATCTTESLWPAKHRMERVHARHLFIMYPRGVSFVIMSRWRAYGQISVTKRKKNERLELDLIRERNAREEQNSR